jgi:hypothetical protein
MIATLLPILLVPACATLAGLVLWAINRGQALEDGNLIRHFLFLLLICAALAWGGSKTVAVRTQVDPQFRLQSELDAHPVYSALKVAREDHKALHAFLVLELAHGATLADAMIKARPLLMHMGNDRLGFADQKSRIQWARVTRDTLKEMQATDALRCYQMFTALRADRQAPAINVSGANAAAFQEALMRVYASADRGLRNVPSGDVPAEFNTAAIEYSVIRDILVQQFGEPVAKQLSEKIFPDLPIGAPEQLCAGRIAQLDAMLARPQAMASILVDSVLR